MNPPLSDNSTFIKREQGGYPLGLAGKGLLVLWSLGLLIGFAVAFGLEPDPRGYGTHQKLGLPPCTFRAIFGIPCPSCGMTTSFAHFMRGEILQSMRVNVAGFLLAAVCAFQVPWCWLSVFRGRLWKISRPEMFLLWLLLVLAAACLSQWVWRLLAI